MNNHGLQKSPNDPAFRDTSRTRLTTFVRQHALLVFFALAFLITWAPTPFGVFMAAGPLVSALVVTAVIDGRRGLRKLGSRLIRWRVGWPWYAAALLIPLAVVLGTGGLNVALGASNSSLRQLELSSLAVVFALRLVVPVFSPIGEEPVGADSRCLVSLPAVRRSKRRSSLRSSSRYGTCPSSSSRKKTFPRSSF